ncbi:MAG: S8 family serine peptidase [Flavobacteriales bacterium]|nr:S8 family serine peptidase [Flavobacteriales bacterium]MCB9449259.1 S8 family serine peptidase [Flavobacteriales bacterium]
MKKILMLFAAMAIAVSAFSQTYSPDFLDGTVVFKMKDVADANIGAREVQPDPNVYSKVESMAQYPALQKALRSFAVSQLERPAYYTGKADLRKVFRVHFDDYTRIDEIIAALKNSDLVEYAEKAPIYKIDYTPNDTYYSGTDKWYLDQVGASTAWDISTGRHEVKVAIVDNAVYTDHLDLTTFKKRDVADGDDDPTPPKQYSQDQSWSHGTHCAGLATADINNSRGIASLGAAVELIGVKTTPNSAADGQSLYYTYDGVLWACQNGAHVVSMSFGGPDFSQAFQDLINAYPEVVFMAAAGNDATTTMSYPGAYDNVICVGSVDVNDSRSSFSNYNAGGDSWVDIASPGGHSYGGLLSSVYTTSSGYGRMGGTSMATPFAAGLVGLMLSVNPTMTPAEIESCLKSTGKTINQSIGPRIDATKAMQCVQSTLTGDPIADFFADQVQLYVGDSTTFTDNSVGGGNAITTWEWTFTGGTPATYNGKTPPAIKYTAPGDYNVSLKVTNSQNNNTKTKTTYIHVSLEPFGAWEQQNSGFSTANRGITNISIVDKNVVWATAYDGSGNAANIQEFTKTTDGGATWTPGTFGLGDTKLLIAMVFAIDANTAWVAAAPNTGSGNGGIWKTTNGGSTWTRQSTATYSNASSFTNIVHFWDANTGFCMGDPINGDFELYTTTNGGTTWTQVSGANIPDPVSGEYGYTGQIEVVGNSVWFTTNKGRLYRSSDKGMTWAVAQTPLTDFGGTSESGRVSFKDASNGIIINNSKKVWRSTDAGATWSAVTTTGTLYGGDVCWIENTNTVFSVGAASGGSGSAFSSDGGTNWNIIDTEPHTCVEFLDSITGWSGWFNESASAKGMWKWKNLKNPLVPDFTADKLQVCAGGSVTFTDQSTGSAPTIWNWTFPGGTPGTSTQQNPTITYSTPGVYDVTLDANDGSGAKTKTRYGYISVITTPATPGTISGNTTPCPGATEVYNVPSVSGATYSWTLPGDWTGTSTISSISATVGSASGNVSVSATNACGTSSNSDLAVTPTVSVPTAGISHDVVGDSVSFTSTSTNADTWQWDFGDGGISYLENPGHTYTVNGTYYVQLIVNNGCGADTTMDTVTITSVGVRELAEGTVELYPNPATGQVQVKLGRTPQQPADMRITDVAGKLVKQVMLQNQYTTLDVSTLPRGLYFITLNGGEAMIRFVKE